MKQFAAFILGYFIFSSPVHGEGLATSGVLPTSAPNIGDMNGRIVKAQRLALTTAYVDCERGNRVHGIPTIESEPEAETDPDAPEKVKEHAPGCEPRNARYFRGGKRMSEENDVVDIVPDDTTDCSGYVSGVLCRAGARLNPEDDDCGPVHTGAMIDWGASGDCFQVAEFTPSSQLKPGCFMVWRNTKTGYGHVVMIEKSGADAMALAKARGCEREPAYANWDFSTTESLQVAGPSRWSGASSRYAKSKLDKPGFILLYKQACKAVASGKALPAEVTSGDWRAKVLCHAGDKKPGCTRPERTFKFESCVARCTNFAD